MKTKGIFCLTAAVAALLAITWLAVPPARAGQQDRKPSDHARIVIEPIQSGNLTIFPVIAGARLQHDTSEFLTLDEGLRSGDVVVTEAGSLRGLQREGTRHPVHGDQVNTLVLINKSERPLILLAGEVITGGKQDRIIAKDRIVPAHSDPLDVSVFCVEPGRWNSKSATFGSGSSGSNNSAGMAAPKVRAGAMAAKNQQEVWNQVRSNNDKMAASVPQATTGIEVSAQAPVVNSSGSYARTMSNTRVQKNIEKIVKPIDSSLLKQLKAKNAVGVVVAVDGELIWTDVFASTELLEKYWPKLIRSYAADAVGSKSNDKQPSLEAAQRFLEQMEGSHQVVESEPGVFRQVETSGNGFKTFELTSLLPKTGFEVHIAKVAEKLIAEVTHNRSEPQPAPVYSQRPVGLQ